jgi:NAD(P)-dependent dehydrogenase (short-subunit alcohol dehydrogenase family)
VPGRVVVVTGASAGVGRAAARAFAAHGDHVAVLARGEAGVRAATRDVEEAGRRALGIPTDVADLDAVEAAADRVESELGPIAVWVNCAFASVFAPFTEIRPDEFRRLTDVTYLGYVWGTRVALARMKPRGAGTIVQVGSALARRGIPLQSGYCGAKHAIDGFTESVRCELLHDRSPVHITVVQLPALNTPQFDWVLSRLEHEPQPVPPIYQPELAGRAVVWAADHPRRREYWVGASTAATIVATSVAPGLLDRYLARRGYQSQQTSRPADPARPANLWEPVDASEDHGARGAFDARSQARSVQWWITRHRGVLVGALTGAGAVLTTRARRR